MSRTNREIRETWENSKTFENAQWRKANWETWENSKIALGRDCTSVLIHCTAVESEGEIIALCHLSNLI